MENNVHDSGYRMGISVTRRRGCQAAQRRQRQPRRRRVATGVGCELFFVAFTIAALVFLILSFVSLQISRCVK